jgi:hypothetical protein
MDDFDRERDREDAGSDAFDFSLMDEDERWEAKKTAEVLPSQGEGFVWSSSPGPASVAPNSEELKSEPELKPEPKVTPEGRAPAPTPPQFQAEEQPETDEDELAVQRQKTHLLVVCVILLAILAVMMSVMLYIVHQNNNAEQVEDVRTPSVAFATASPAPSATPHPTSTPSPTSTP